MKENLLGCLEPVGRVFLKAMPTTSTTIYEVEDDDGLPLPLLAESSWTPQDWSGNQREGLLQDCARFPSHGPLELQLGVGDCPGLT